MPLAPARPWLSGVLLAVLVFLPLSASAEEYRYKREGKLFEETKAKAEKGDPEAQLLMGAYYIFEIDGRDVVQAVSWYRKAADQGNASAQVNLGAIYRGDYRRVAKDLVEAAKWYRKAAAQGDALGQFYLGSCYAKGEGVAQDMPQAVEWTRKSADQGEVMAQVALGDYYLGKRSESGLCDPRAAAASASPFTAGGVHTDFVQAVSWYRKAADQGNAVAQVGLAGFYEDGRVGVVPKDLVEAYAYNSIARQKPIRVMPNDSAGFNLARLEESMSDDQIAAGKKRTIELQKEIDAKIAAKQAEVVKKAGK